MEETKRALLRRTPYVVLGTYRTSIKVRYVIEWSVATCYERRAYVIYITNYSATAERHKMLAWKFTRWAKNAELSNLPHRGIYEYYRGGWIMADNIDETVRRLNTKMMGEFQDLVEKNISLQSRVQELENPDKCYWCGNTKANFYHVKCAQKMSQSNCGEFSKVLAMYQSENTRLREALQYLADENSWDEDEAGFNLIRPKHAGRQVGIMLISRNICPWVFAQQALSNQGED